MPEVFRAFRIATMAALLAVVGCASVDESATVKPEYSARLQAAAQEPDAEKRSGMLLELISEDPSRPAELAAFRKTLSDIRLESRRELTARLYDIAYANPSAFDLGVTAVRLSERTLSPEATRRLAWRLTEEMENPWALSAEQRYRFWNLAKYWRNDAPGEDSVSDKVDFIRRMEELGFQDDEDFLPVALTVYGTGELYGSDARRWLGMQQSLRDECRKKADEYAAKLDVRRTLNSTEYRINVFETLQTFCGARRLEDFCRRVLTVCPGDHMAAWRLGTAMHLSGRYCEAAEYQELQAGLQPDYAYQWAFCAMINYHLAGDREKALAVARKYGAPDLEVFLAMFSRDWPQVEKLLAEDRVSRSVRPMAKSVLWSRKDDFAAAFAELDEWRKGMEFSSRQSDRELEVFLNAFFETCAAAPPELGRKRFWEMYAEIDAAGLWNDPEVCNMAGYALYRMNIASGEAERLIDIALEHDPWNSAYLDSAAAVAMRLGRLDDARRYIERSLTAPLLPDRSVLDGRNISLERAGDIYLTLGDDDKALACYRSAVEAGNMGELEFSPERVREKIRRLEIKEK